MTPNIRLALFLLVYFAAMLIAGTDDYQMAKLSEIKMVVTK